MSQTANQSPREQHWLIRGVLWVRNVLLRNWPLKLLSLVLALALWAGLIAQDPTLTRDKVFRDVSPSTTPISSSAAATSSPATSPPCFTAWT